MIVFDMNSRTDGSTLIIHRLTFRESQTVHHQSTYDILVIPSSQSHATYQVTMHPLVTYNIIITNISRAPFLTSAHSALQLFTFTMID